MFHTKIIHQMWIGPKKAPTVFMKTWKEKFPDYEYIFWNEEEIKKRNMKFTCKKRIKQIEEICGKVDIMRWEILYKYGGIFLDADSICIEKFNEEILKNEAFASYENEIARPGLIAIGTMGFRPKHKLIKKIIDHIKVKEVSGKKTGYRAWYNVGPKLFTDMINKYKTLSKDIKTLPSYYFLPDHFTGQCYNSHGKVFAYQEWGSTKQNYEIMNNIKLPIKFLTPTQKVTVLMSSLNTKAIHLKQCLDSIKNQVGYFSIDLIIINDGSDILHTSILKKMLEKFESTTRFINILYHENNKNMGLGYSLNKGVLLSNNEIILRMDTDDIMVQDRIIKQIYYMKNNPDSVLVGAQIQMFEDNTFKNLGMTNHPNLTLEGFLKNKTNHWLMNHPTFCFRKSKILSIGNYDKNIKRNMEDFDLILRVLKEHGKIENMKDVLLKYRIHKGQLTHNGGKEGGTFWNNKRMDLIDKIFS